MKSAVEFIFTLFAFYLLISTFRQKVSHTHFRIYYPANKVHKYRLKLQVVKKRYVTQKQVCTQYALVVAVLLQARMVKI